MSIKNPFWGAPRIHGELLKLGLPSQGWHTFLHNHVLDIAAMDLFIAQSHRFRLMHLSSFGWTVEILSESM